MTEQHPAPILSGDGLGPRERAVWDRLQGVIDPEIRKPLTELGMVTGIRVDGDDIAHLEVKLTIVGCPAARQIERDTQAAAESAAGIAAVELTVGVMSTAERTAFTERVRAGKPARVNQFGPDSLTRVIAVTSGKGGVGKSSVTAGLAVEFASRGLAVGVIDADVFGFSIPGLLGQSVDGVTVQPTRVGDMILPPVAHGVKSISIGMFLGDQDTRNTAVSWRGPMLHRTISQFLTDVWFGDLDVLLLDLPPGTGDIAISLGQLLPNAEVLVVTTPQPAAADVAVRSALVARQSGQRVIGVVENMAGLAQPDGSVLELFGTGGGQEVADRLSDEEHGPVPLLGKIPLSVSFREAGDAGTPAVLAAPEDPAARALAGVADRLLERGRGLAGRPLGLSVR